MPKSCNSISRTSQSREALTLGFSAGKSLFLIGIACLWSQEANEMVREPYKRLEIQNQITTFFEFFQVWFFLFTPQNLVVFGCNCTLYTTDWIRVTNVLSIFINYGLWSWFDFHENLSKIGQKLIFLCTTMPYTIWFSC